MKHYRAFAVSFLLLPLTARAETVFVPVVNVPAAAVASSQGSLQSVEWVSTFALSNASDIALRFSYVRMFGASYAHLSGGCVQSVVPPKSLWQVSSIGAVNCAYSGGAPAFAEVEIDSGLIPTAGIHLVAFRSCYQNSPAPLGVSLAAAPLPVYRTPFPPNSTAISTDISVSTPLAPDDQCRDGNDPVSRRVNVTIVNVGPITATATVTAAGSTATPYVITLDAGSVQQINGVFPNVPFQALLVSASQQFLCYGSSVLTWSDSTRAPSIEVYPFSVAP